MSQRLFSVPKVGLFLDSYRPAIEKRRGEETKVLQLTLRVQPFDAKLATAIDDGVGEDSNVRATLFKLGHPDPKPHLDRVDFALGCPRQNLTIYASPDTQDARIQLQQVKIAGTYARTEKGINDYGFVFKATFGPVGRDEQEYIHEWYLSQRFVSFEEAEPLMEFEDDGDADLVEADEKAREVIDGRSRPAPMWEDGDEQPAPKSKPKRDGVNRKLHSHAAGKKKTRRALQR